MRDFLKVSSQVRNVSYGKCAYYGSIFIASVVMFIISVARLLHVLLWILWYLTLTYGSNFIRCCLQTHSSHPKLYIRVYASSTLIIPRLATYTITYNSLNASTLQLLRLCTKRNNVWMRSAAWATPEMYHSGGSRRWCQGRPWIRLTACFYRQEALPRWFMWKVMSTLD